VNPRAAKSNDGTTPTAPGKVAIDSFIAPKEAIGYFSL
jgi:hypothetical protein